MATELPRSQARFTLSEIARETGGKLVGADREVAGIETDTRALELGALFLALRGERFDGSRFVPEAAAKGAAAFVVEDASALPAGASGVVVADTLRALGDVAAFHRRRLATRVVAITGSAGKTTTKELVADALAATGLVVHRTRGNLNNRIGVPLTLLALDARHDVAVIEMGTSERGEIARLTEVAAPDVGVLTLVAAAHTQGLGSIEEVAAEKGAMLRGLGPNAVGIANADDAFARAALMQSSLQDRRLFGRSSDAAVRLVSTELEAELSTLAVYETKGKTRMRSLRLRLLGEAAAMNVAAALTVVASLGSDLDRASAALQASEAVPGRMHIPDPTAAPLVIDDTYNSNPRSLELSLRAAARLAEARGGRLVAVLGDMLELGARSQLEHTTVVSLVASLEARALVVVGPLMHAATETAGGTLKRVALTQVETSRDAAAPALAAARPEDVVLVKGSRGLRMELALDELTRGGRS